MSDVWTFPPSGSGVVGVLWQTGLFLIVGLAASLALRRHPARAHRVLFLAVLGALIAPLGSQLAHRQGWGLWATASGETPPSPASPPVEPSPAVASSPGSRRADVKSAAGSMPAAPERSSPGARLAIEGWTGARDWSSVPVRMRPLLPDLALGAWSVLSGLCLVRLVVSMILGYRVVGRARPLASGALARAAESAAMRLGLPAPPELRASAGAACPAIWCWGRRPIILMPEDAAGAAAVDWIGVFCHELAHWVRRDHWSGLLAEVLTCLLPWQPLAWWARQRLGQLSELACDDWALSTGLEATDYAESLLGLVPQRRGALALAAVTSRRGLIGRVRHILDEPRSSPVVSTRWTILSVAGVVTAASVLALAQTRPAGTKDPEIRSKPDAGAPPTSGSEPTDPKGTALRRTIRGTVLGPDGQPVAGATVLWIAHRRPTLPDVAMPKDHQARRSTRTDVLGETRTDAKGAFALAADFPPDRYVHQEGFEGNFLVKAPGLGMVAPFLKSGATEVTLRMAPEVVIRGRLLTPSGLPATDVRVTLRDFFNDEMTDGMGVDATWADVETPAYWPKPRTTGADGRFTLEGMPEGTYAVIELRHPDYAADELTVNTGVRGGIKAVLNAWVKAFEIAPVQPTFTHALEPARPVQGRVTDKATGQPLAGILVQMSAMRRHGGTPLYTRTDADGRYHISGHSADSYWTTVYPPADSAYLAIQDHRQGWPVGAKFLETNFALDKGRIVRGSVIDADGRRPIAGASVVYQPRRGNPNNRREYHLDNKVLTGADGRFAITTLPGQGLVAVETPDQTYLHVPLNGGYRVALLCPQGLAAIDVPQEGEPKPVEIAVRKGVPLEATVLGPDGKAVSQVVCSCEGIDVREIHAWNHGAEVVTEGRFHLLGADPSRTYRVFFLQPDRKLGAVVDLKPDPRATRPVEVRLQPMATVRGRLINAGGSAEPGAQVYPALVPREKVGEMSRAEILHDATPYFELLGERAMLTYWLKIHPNPQGEFVLDTLVPGAQLSIVAGSGQREARVPVTPLKPGEDRDLGTITLEERRP